METRLSAAEKEVIISDKGPTLLIGERINPAGKPKLSAELKAGRLEIIKEEAIAQVQAGADILDVNVGSPDIDEVSLLPEAVRAIIDVVDVPLCLDSSNHKALEAGLKVYEGKALVSSVTAERHILKDVLPLVKEYGSAVVGLTMDKEGIPTDFKKRAEIAERILAEAEAFGIPHEDVVIDCLAMTVGADKEAGNVALQAIRQVKAELGVNQTLGVSNVSFGLPDRELINGTFLAIAISAGVTCPIVEVGKLRSLVLATDLVLGRDMYARRYTQNFSQRQK